MRTKERFFCKLKTDIKRTYCDWTEVKNECRHTSAKEDTDVEATESFKKKILISEHSPLRLISIKWRWDNIKSWIATHFVRHHVGITPFVQTQRSDRVGGDRDKTPQDSPVSIDMVANPQAIINMAKLRLCYQAHSETRAYMYDLKRALKLYDDTKEISNVLVPSCVYRFGCPEFKTCGLWNRFVNFCMDYYIEKGTINSDDMCFDAYGETLKKLIDIQERYNMFDEFCNAKLYIENL